MNVTDFFKITFKVTKYNIRSRRNDKYTWSGVVNMPFLGIDEKNS